MNLIGLGLLLICIGIVVAVVGYPFGGLIALLGAIAFLVGIFRGERSI
jgi:hypothetical protein